MVLELPVLIWNHIHSIGSLGKSKSRAEVHDIIVDGAFISNTENGVRIKTWQVIFLSKLVYLAFSLSVKRKSKVY